MASNQFNQQNASTWLADQTNLGPVYSLDPTQTSQALASLQAALAYVQQNPSADPTGYYASTLQQSLAEQQYINQYVGAQTAATTASDNLNYLGGIFGQILNGNAGNSNEVTAGDWSAIAQYLKQNGDPTIALPGLTAPGQTPQPISAADLIGQLLQKDPGQLYIIGQALNNAGITGNVINALQTQYNNANTTATKDLATASQNFTLPQADPAAQQNQLASYLAGAIGGQWQGANGQTFGTAGQLGSVTLPQTQNIYATAYQTKQQAAKQLNNAGLGSSGEKKQVMGNIDSGALNQALTNLQQQQNAGATAQGNLQTQQSQNKANYQNLVNQVIGNSGANLFGSSAGNAIQNYESNTAGQGQAQLNQAESQIQQAQNNSNWANSILGTLGNTAGTLAGGAVAGLI